MVSVNRILSGIVILDIDGVKVFVRPPSVEDKLIADHLSEEIYEECLYSGSFTKDELVEHLIKLGLWSDAEEKQLKEKETFIEQAKLDYFLNFSIDVKRRHIKYNLDLAIDELSRLEAKKNYLFDKTCEYVSGYVKLIHILSSSSYIDNKERLNGQINLVSLVTEYNNNSLSEEQIRGIAKSNEWKSIWNVSKSTNGLFKSSASELTIEQAAVISWSRLYDNIQESPDAPSEQIINDDIAFDGWLIHQGRKRKEEEKQKQAESLMPEKAKDAGELFIPVRNMEEQSQILSLNSGYGKMALSSIKSDLEEKGHLHALELTHVRNEIQMEVNQRRKK